MRNRAEINEGGIIESVYADRIIGKFDSDKINVDYYIKSSDWIIPITTTLSDYINRIEKRIVKLEELTKADDYEYKTEKKLVKKEKDK